MPPPTIGHAIKNRRLELGLSQQELADRLGPDVRIADVARLETLGTARDIRPLIAHLRHQLEEAETTLWVLEILVDANDVASHSVNS